MGFIASSFIRNRQNLEAIKMSFISEYINTLWHTQTEYYSKLLRNELSIHEKSETYILPSERIQHDIF